MRLHGVNVHCVGLHSAALLGMGVNEVVARRSGVTMWVRMALVCAWRGRPWRGRPWR
jgi:hypothetical protein